MPGRGTTDAICSEAGDGGTQVKTSIGVRARSHLDLEWVNIKDPH